MAIPKEVSDHFAHGDYPIKVTRMVPQNDLSLHTHPFFELVIITGGSGLHFTREIKHPITSGDVFVISGDRAHGYMHCENLTLTNILFHPDRFSLPEMDIKTLPGYNALFTLEPYFQERHRFESRFRLSRRELDRVNSYVEKLEDELSSQSPGYQFMALSYFMQLIAYLSRSFSKAPDPAARPLLRAGKAISFIEHNYSQPLTLEEISEACHMSVSTLLRTFRNALGISPIEYLLNLRVTKAKELLRHTNALITDIAFQTGFTDSNYFARQFRKITGASPSQYRKRPESVT